MGRFLFGIIIGIGLVAAGAYGYFSTGMAPVAATAQPMPFEALLAKMALHARLRAEAPETVPIQPTPENLLAGAELYKRNCAFCHGLPGAKPSEEGTGMFPHAPQLFVPSEMVTDDPPGVTYWKVKNGIRLSGMPSFEKALTDRQMWQVALLLRNADKLPSAVAASLAAARAVAPPPSAQRR